MRGIKKKWMLPVIVFFIGMAILGITVYGEKCIQQKQSRKMADLNAMTYAERMKTDIMQGPFQLKQGGYGIAVRKPVYLEDESGQEFFWGFTIVIIRVPEIFSDSVKPLSDFGY